MLAAGGACVCRVAMVTQTQHCRATTHVPTAVSPPPSMTTVSQRQRQPRPQHRRQHRPQRQLLSPFPFRPFSLPACLASPFAWWWCAWFEWVVVVEAGLLHAPLPPPPRPPSRPLHAACVTRPVQRGVARVVNDHCHARQLKPQPPHLKAGSQGASLDLDVLGVGGWLARLRPVQGSSWHCVVVGSNRGLSTAKVGRWRWHSFWSWRRCWSRCCVQQQERGG